MFVFVYLTKADVLGSGENSQYYIKCSYMNRGNEKLKISGSVRRLPN